MVSAPWIDIEGVETEGQLERLRAMDCDYGQGFLLCRALDAEGIENFLERREEGALRH